MTAFFYGFILSCGLIFPLGVQNIFIFNQGVTQQKFLHAMPSVMTAFICDMLLILSAILGLSVVILTVPSIKTILYGVGFCFLLYIGWVTWHSRSAFEGERKPLSAKQQIGFCASVSLLNPHAIIDTIGVIGTNSLNFIGKDKWLFTLACILVSFGWFFGLSLAGHFFNKFGATRSAIRWLNKVSALIIWAVAFYLAKNLFS